MIATSAKRILTADRSDGGRKQQIRSYGTLACVFLWAAWVASPAAAQLPYFERFNDDGDGVRYTVEGRGIDLTLPEGPGYWEHNFDLPIPVEATLTAPGRWAALLWTHEGDFSTWTTDAVDVFESTVNWAVDNKPNANIVMTPPPTTANETGLRDHLASLGHNIIEVAGADPLPNAAGVDLVLYSSSAAIDPVTKLNRYAASVITWHDGSHDDLGISSIGSTVTLDPANVDIQEPAHPAAGGKTGSIQWTTGAANLRSPGVRVPAAGTVVATYSRVTPGSVQNLAQTDDIIGGVISANTFNASIEFTDLTDSTTSVFGNFADHAIVPGAGTGTLAFEGLAQIEVKQTGTYSFALSGDDGGRFRIDVDGNGFDDGDNVIVDDAQHAFQDSFGEATLAAGTYDIQWVGFNTTGGFGSELAVAFNPGGGQMGPINFDNWEPFGDHLDSSPIVMLGMADVTAFYPDLPDVIEELPALVVVEEGENLLGGIIDGWEGPGFFAGADMDAGFGGGANPRAVQLNPVDVSGAQDVKLSVAAAATTLDFDVGQIDALRVMIDIDGAGPQGFITLAEFTPDGSGALSDGTTRLTENFQDLTYDVPEDATDLIVRIEAISTFWNEIIAIDNIRITAGPLGLEGDTNGDGLVNIDDLNNVRNNFGEMGPDDGTLVGDSFPFDGMVNIDDLNNVRNNFGAMAPSPVPEPAASFTALLALAALVGRRRRRRG